MLRPYEPLLSIAPEGWGVVAALGCGSLMLSATGALVPSMLLAATLPLAARFCADPRHGVACKARGVLAPFDGRVIHRRECHDEVLGREAIRLTLRASLWGSYCLRAPIGGTVVAVPGQRSGTGASRIRTDEGEDIVLRVSRGHMLGTRPVMVPVGERVGQGRRCGLRRLAREVEILLPAGSRVEVQLGQRVRSGETLLATLLRKA